MSEGAWFRHGDCWTDASEVRLAACAPVARCRKGGAFERQREASLSRRRGRGGMATAVRRVRGVVDGPREVVR